VFLFGDDLGDEFTGVETPPVAQILRQLLSTRGFRSRDDGDNPPFGFAPAALRAMLLLRFYQLEGLL